MIILEAEQSSPEWFAARCGIPTASCFKDIFTSQGKASSSASNYMYKLLAEWVTGAKTEIKQNEWMERGVILEQEAREFYEFQTDNDVKQVGLVFQDESKMIACSPDGLIGNDKGLELKCPAPHTHVKYLLANKVPSEYVPQVQGSMMVTGAKSWDFMSYHPDIDPLMLTVDRDEEYIEGLQAALDKFVINLLKQREKLTELGIKEKSE